MVLDPTLFHHKLLGYLTNCKNVCSIAAPALESRVCGRSDRSARFPLTSISKLKCTILSISFDRCTSMVLFTGTDAHARFNLSSLETPSPTKSTIGLLEFSETTVCERCTQYDRYQREKRGGGKNLFIQQRGSRKVVCTVKRVGKIV